MGGKRWRVIAPSIFGAMGLAMLALAFPARAQDATSMLFLSDRHGETLCEQTWFDIYAISTAPTATPTPSLDFGASIGGRFGVLLAGFLGQEDLGQEESVRRITNARAQTPDADAYCTIGYHRAVLSPDGSLIAAVRREGSSQVVVVMNVDGSEQRVVSHPQEGHVTSVSWAPDGRRLVHDGRDVLGLKIVSIDGGDPIVIPETQMFADPAWSHDGRWIAFTFAPQEDNPRFRNALGVIAPDGKGFRQVTLDPDIAAAARPAWSPDDSEIAFSTQNPGCGGERVSIVPFTGAGEYETLPVPAEMCRSGGPAWLSDTEMAFWGAVGTGEPDLYTMRRGDGASLLQLTSDEDIDVDPTVTFVGMASGPARQLPRTDGDGGAPGEPTTTDAEPAAGRGPLLIGGVVVAVIVALLGGRTALATAAARAGRARTQSRERDRSSGHASCESRWEAASDRARAARASSGASLDETLSGLREGWRALLDPLEDARSAFQTLDPTEDALSEDEEMLVVQRLLGTLGDIVEGDDAR